MKDLPLFPCADGMASLILNEIPYRGEAYVIIRCVYGSQARLLQQCGDFCRQAGAKAVYVSGEGDFKSLPVYARLVQRSLDKARLPQSRAVAVETDQPHWAELYNARFRQVPAAKTYLETPQGAYFITLDSQLIGLGQIIDDELAAVASLKKGSGQDCVCALAAQIRQTRISLLCAEENLPAVRLYDRLGFSRDEVKRLWYIL